MAKLQADPDTPLRRPRLPAQAQWAIDVDIDQLIDEEVQRSGYHLLLFTGGTGYAMSTSAELRCVIGVGHLAGAVAATVTADTARAALGEAIGDDVDLLRRAMWPHPDHYARTAWEGDTRPWFFGNRTDSFTAVRRVRNQTPPQDVGAVAGLAQLLAAGTRNYAVLIAAVHHLIRAHLDNPAHDRSLYYDALLNHTYQHHRYYVTADTPPHYATTQ